MRKIIELKTYGVLKGFLYGAEFFLLYYSSHVFMVKWWEREDYNYCYLIPFIVVDLIWERLTILRQIPAEPSWYGFIPLFAGLSMFWLGELGGEYYTLYLSSWFVLLGLCWINLGWRKFKVILFPITFVLTMFPPPSFIYNNGNYSA